MVFSEKTCAYFYHQRTLVLSNFQSPSWADEPTSFPEIGGSQPEIRKNPDTTPRLLDILSGGSWDASRVEAAQRVEDLVQALIQGYKEMKMSDQEAQSLLEGKWCPESLV